jgi:hypothetical protein
MMFFATAVDHSLRRQRLHPWLMLVEIAGAMSTVRGSSCVGAVQSELNRDLGVYGIGIYLQ